MTINNNMTIINIEQLYKNGLFGWFLGSVLAIFEHLPNCPYLLNCTGFWASSTLPTPLSLLEEKEGDLSGIVKRKD